MKDPILSQIENLIKSLQLTLNELTNKINADNKKNSVKKMNCINTIIVKLYQLLDLYED
jgi:hypothetical protein